MVRALWARGFTGSLGDEHAGRRSLGLQRDGGARLPLILE